MKYNRHFDYEVRWAGEYYNFKYLQDARRFVRNKSCYTLVKCHYDGEHFKGYTWIGEG